MPTSHNFGSTDRPDGFDMQPLANATFGGLVLFDDLNAQDAVALCEAHPGVLPDALYAAGGLLVLPGMNAISEQPELLLRLSRLFGPEVENYRQTLTSARHFHESVAEILLLSNLPPCYFVPPPRPDPPRTPAGDLPVQFPHHKGWHTDQSYRRPPPDISLFYGVRCPPKGQGQTLYADSHAAFDALPITLQDRISGLDGIHAMRSIGRSEEAVLASVAPKPLLPHQQPQRQPLVRVHPVTGKRALYLCEDGQMEWVDGPVAGLTPGPDGEGARLVHQLITHITQPKFVYVHDWTPGDLVIHDNRNLLHSATWYDTDKYPRLMWRTTVRGNPGEAYAGESKSWIPAPGLEPMEGLKDL